MGRMGRTGKVMRAAFICGVARGKGKCQKKFKTLAGLLYHIAKEHMRRTKENPDRYKLAEQALRLGM
jgi:hypothetical protein